MITQEPTKEMFEEWKATWLQYKDRLHANRKTGTELLHYLQDQYILTELYEKEAGDAVVENVTMNAPYAEKLPTGVAPAPRTFFLENQGNGTIFFKDENKDAIDVWGGDITRIFVGIDQVTGFFMIEGSTMLHDELIAFRGLDEKDLQNYVCVSEYLCALKRYNLLENIVSE